MSAKRPLRHIANIKMIIRESDFSKLQKIIKTSESSENGPSSQTATFTKAKLTSLVTQMVAAPGCSTDKASSLDTTKKEMLMVIELELSLTVACGQVIS